MRIQQRTSIDLKHMINQLILTINFTWYLYYQMEK